MLDKISVRNGSLILHQGGFSGGRQNVKGDGYVIIEFTPIDEYGEYGIDVFDKLNTEDGHYAPLHLNKKELSVLRDWIDYQLGE